MKTCLLLIFIITSLGVLAQSSHVKKDTVLVLNKENNTKSAVLILQDYFGKPLQGGYHYRYTASLSHKTVTSALTVDYGDKIPDGSATIAIYDTIGKLMQSSTYKQGGGKDVVELSSSIKPGKYNIVVYQWDDRVLLRDQFLKQ